MQWIVPHDVIPLSLRMTHPMTSCIPLKNEKTKIFPSQKKNVTTTFFLRSRNMIRNQFLTLPRNTFFETPKRNLQNFVKLVKFHREGPIENIFRVPFRDPSRTAPATLQRTLPSQKRAHGPFRQNDPTSFSFCDAHVHFHVPKRVRATKCNIW